MYGKSLKGKIYNGKSFQYEISSTMHILKMSCLTQYCLTKFMPKSWRSWQIKDCLSVMAQQIKRRRKKRWMRLKGIGFIEWRHIKLGSIPHFPQALGCNSCHLGVFRAMWSTPLLRECHLPPWAVLTNRVYIDTW